jgi:F-type H+-transporting ATPase subunit b
MPQLDPTTFAPQLIWLAITFVLLYLLMANVGLPAVGRVIDERRNRINTDLAEARRMNKEAETILASYERALSEARAEAQAHLRQTMDKLNAESTERLRQASERLSADIEAAEARIAALKKTALDSVRGVAIDVARDVTLRLAGAVPDETRLAAAVDGVLKERA